MLTMRRLLELIQSGSWFTTINLKGVYFHVKVAPKHRKFLCFAFQGIAYDYNRLLFNYSPSSRSTGAPAHMLPAMVVQGRL